ncbi:unnamed protein product [Prorocentrum cordatum]|uniref:Uncharacterized protein n=1 Tax=Prorocentrum cordatum TaxID=2364126 RepID=A0ABN9RPW5_9DINO|nr:unnamed protein product [Polarella glacialis]
MVRCQEVPLEEAFIGSMGFPRARGEDLVENRFVLSHPWLSKSHPDPKGAKLQVLVQQLNVLHASNDDAVFIDYMGLPQNDKMHPDYDMWEKENKVPKPGEHPAVRTKEEEALFKKALGSMELIYSMGNTPVIVLAMDDEVVAGTKYFSRGWCFFEFSLAFSFDNITNAYICPSVWRMYERAAELEVDAVEGFRKGFEKTHFTNKGDEETVFNLFKQTVNKKVRVAALGADEQA